MEQMKSKWIKIGKVLLSGLLAFVLLTLFSMLYANTPAHHHDPDGATDYRWDPDTFYSQAKEGFSAGHTNNEGYYCLRDYHAGDPVDILVMGSSHMEASNVQPEQSTAALLDSMLEDKAVYNIGTSAHLFLVCADNLKQAVKKYSPREYVILETDRLRFSDEELRAVLEGTMKDIPSLEGGWVSLLQENQYLRLLYRQLQNRMGGNIRLPASQNRLRGVEEAPAEADTEEEADDTQQVDAEETGQDEAQNEQLLSELLGNLSDACKAKGARLIIFFHPSTTVHEDGLLHMEYFDEDAERFRNLCEENGITFLSMTGRFAEEYDAHYTVAYGFPNTLVGTGHLNKHGHKMIAEELYKLITEDF